ncbi:hypothetical protein ACFX19_023201 [Malus domestica]
MFRGGKDIFPAAVDLHLNPLVKGVQEASSGYKSAEQVHPSPSDPQPTVGGAKAQVVDGAQRLETAMLSRPGGGTEDGDCGIERRIGRDHVFLEREIWGSKKCWGNV